MRLSAISLFVAVATALPVVITPTNTLPERSHDGLISRQIHHIANILQRVPGADTLSGALVRVPSLAKKAEDDAQIAAREAILLDGLDMM